MNKEEKWKKKSLDGIFFDALHEIGLLKKENQVKNLNLHIQKDIYFSMTQFKRPKEFSLLTSLRYQKC